MAFVDVEFGGVLLNGYVVFLSRCGFGLLFCGLFI